MKTSKYLKTIAFCALMLAAAMPGKAQVFPNTYINIDWQVGVALGAPAGVCHSKRWSWCDPRQDHRFYSFKMQQEAPISGASCQTVEKPSLALSCIYNLSIVL